MRPHSNGARKIVRFRAKLTLRKALNRQNMYRSRGRLKICPNHHFYRWKMATYSTHPPTNLAGGGPLGGGVPGPSRRRGGGAIQHEQIIFWANYQRISANIIKLSAQLLGPIKGRFAAHYRPFLGHFWVHFRANIISLRIYNICHFWALFSLILSQLQPNYLQNVQE